ncbi:MAG: PD-(D/E)XK nuclease family protein [Thermoguttaceae bacterium]
MRQSHSHSKRDLLETCARRYFYEYYAASLKPARRLPTTQIQKSLFDDEAAGVAVPLSSERILLAHRLKRLSGCFLLAGDILHQLIALHLKKKPDWSVEWFAETARSRLDQAINYSRDPIANASLAERKYPPPMLLEFYYGDPKADEYADQAREKLLRAIRNYFETPQITELRDMLLLGDHRIEERFFLDEIDGFGLNGQVDLAGYDQLGVQVIDWKIGSIGGNHDSLQLVTYGWWAAREFGVDPTTVRVRRAFLGDPSIEDERALTKSLLRRGMVRIIQDIELMKQMDKYGKAGNEEAFPPCEIENVCRQCRYQALCPANRSGLNSKQTSGSSPVLQPV